MRPVRMQQQVVGRLTNCSPMASGGALVCLRATLLRIVRKIRV